mmetsp:Transcript_20698/g.26122  ORF Transcript_20698/g.26122 Transcript_20698/m.26122 type:complete len:125 (-) Transcript_20698:103-477(-)
MHPAPGHGGNSALLGACTLVEKIRDASAPKSGSASCNDGDGKKASYDWKTILKHYEDTHRPRAEFLQLRSNYVGSGKRPTKEHDTLVNTWLSRLFLPGEATVPKEVDKILREFDVLKQEHVTAL